MGDKIRKYDLLLGDFIKYRNRFSSVEQQGYVIGISTRHYYIIDLDNSAIYIEKINSTIIMSDTLDQVIIMSIDAEILDIKRSMYYSSGYICNELCRGLKNFPEACELYCPCRKINSTHTYLPGDVYKGLTINMVSFLFPNYLLIIPQGESGYDCILSNLAGSFPKPRYPFKDMSVDGLKDIFSNPNKYDIYQRVYYLMKPSSLNKTILEWIDIDKNLIEGKTYLSLLKKDHPCSYCIYDEDSCNKCNCKLKNLIYNPKK